MGMMGKANQPGASLFVASQQGFIIAITTRVLRFSVVTMPLSAWSAAKLHPAEEAFRPDF